MVANAREAPYAPPTSRTAKVWPVIGTGVCGRWIETWADAAMRATPSATSTASAASATTRLLGRTSVGTIAVEDMAGSLAAGERQVERGRHRRSRRRVAQRRDAEHLGVQ